jgi:hypothetical protein
MNESSHVAGEVGVTGQAGQAGRDWEGRLLGWGNVALEMAVVYLLLAAWARPRDGQAALLPLLACLALPAALAIRGLLDSAEVGDAVRLLATWLAALAWALSVARLCAPPGYWQSDSPRGLLLLSAVFGGREVAGPQPLAFWASLLLWWRGQLLSAWEPTLEDALGRFRLGCLAVGAAVGLAAADDGSGSGSIVQLEQALGVATFFVAALLTTGLGRRREMAGGGSLPAGPAAPGPGTSARAARSRLAPAPLLVIAAALLALAVAAWGADALSPEALAPAAALGGQVLEALGTAIVIFFHWLGNLWPSITLPASPPQPGEPAPAQPDRLRPLAAAVLAWLGPLLLIAAVVGAAALAGLLYVAARRALRDSFDDGIHALHGNDNSGPAPITPRAPVILHPLRTLVLLARLFRALFGRPRGGAPGDPGAGSDGGAPADPALRSIRAAYRAFLAWAAERGWARRPEETPDEFHRRLAISCPEAEAEAGLLTTLYVAARYGGQPCSPGDLQRADLALARLRAKR